MSFDFFKNLSNWENEEQFAKLCEGLEDVIRQANEQGGENKITELELMQAIDFVGFNMFRDNWEEFKKMNLNRDLNFLHHGQREKNFLH